MTTLDTEAGTAAAIEATTTQETTQAAGADTAALITEQQVLFASTAALAPARRHHFPHHVASAVRAMFVRPERSHPHKHYPQRFAYLENSVMSREMGRL